MIHKARTTCPNGHSVEFGPCNKEFTRLFFFKSVCASTDHEVISPDEIECQRCHTVHIARMCSKCGEPVPVSKFKQKSLTDRLKR